jgi:hypothetical protein
MKFQVRLWPKRVERPALIKFTAACINHADLNYLIYHSRYDGTLRKFCCYPARFSTAVTWALFLN